MDSVWIAKYIQKSKSSLNEAEICLKAGLHRAAIARVYYSIYQAANAWMELKGYPRTNGARRNWHHNEANKSWSQILAQLGNTDMGADAVYNSAQDFRVRVEYQVGPEPSPNDARKCVEACKFYVDLILAGLKKEGHNGDR